MAFVHDSIELARAAVKNRKLNKKLFKGVNKEMRGLAEDGFTREEVRTYNQLKRGYGPKTTAYNGPSPVLSKGTTANDVMKGQANEIRIQANALKDMGLDRGSMRSYFQKQRGIVPKSKVRGAGRDIEGERNFLREQGWNDESIDNRLKPSVTKSVEKGKDPVSKSVQNTYTEADRVKLAKDMNEMGPLSKKEMPGFFLDQTKGNVKSVLASEGHDPTWGGLAKATGKDMLKGAVVGGAVGGGLSAVQGGDFWDGAKEGAFNGAMGWGAVNAYRRGIGAESVLRGPHSIKNTVSNSYKARKMMAEADGKVSKQALALLNNHQMAGLSSAVAKRQTPSILSIQR